MNSPNSNTLTPHHPEWNAFTALLGKALESRPCDAQTLTQSKQIITKHFPIVDQDSTIKYFKAHGGYCDCEVLMNVDVL